MTGFGKTGSNWRRPSLSHFVAGVFLWLTICRKRCMCVAVCITLVVRRDGSNSLQWTGNVNVYHLHLHKVSEALDILIFVNIILILSSSCAFSKLLPWQLLN